MQGLIGIVVILAIAILASKNRRAINPRIVICAFLLQLFIALIALKTPFGVGIIDAMSGFVLAVLGAANAGIAMIFGDLANTERFPNIFAVTVLPIIIFFSSLMAILYHFGIMQVIVAGLGKALRFIIGTQPVESLNAAANVFVGQTEAPLALKPYLPLLTKPQLFAVMVSGLASVAGTVLLAYTQILGEDMLPYLLTASFMAAPGGLLMAKLIMPDDKEEVAEEQVISLTLGRKEHENFIMAAAVGAQDGLKLAVNIAAMLIAFVALIALVNMGLGAVGGWFGKPDLSMQYILGLIFSPVMYAVGIPWADAQMAGGIFGEKVIINEFIAYLSLADVTGLSDKSRVIMTFALCGFANLSSIGILLGGLGSLIPDRMPLIAKYGFYAVLAASLANLMSAAIAGVLFSFGAG